MSELVRTDWYFLYFTKYLLVYTLKTPSLRPATDFSSTKVTSDVLTHVTYISLMRITSFKFTSSFMSLTYKWFAVMWLPEIDCYRHWYIFWYYPAILVDLTLWVRWIFHSCIRSVFQVPFVILQYLSEKLWARSAPIFHLNSGVHNCYCSQQSWALWC